MMRDAQFVRRRLTDFSKVGYDKGRPLVTQAVWFATQNLVFGTWWFPARLRPTVLRCFGATIGSGVHIRHHVRILWPWKLSIGDHSWIGEGAWLLNLEYISIGANVCISQEAFLCTGSHDHRSETFEFDNAPITIEDNSWVAAQALVLRGVRVRDGAMVGARAVVTRSVNAGDTVPAGTRH